MAFTKKNTFTSQIDTSGATKLDQSQINKLSDVGLQVTPVSNDPNVLVNTTPTIKTTDTGLQIPGFQDGKGDFYVLSDGNVVHDVKDTPTTPNNNDGGGGIINNPTTFNPSQPPILPPSLPPSNLGSGRIYTRFDNGDIVPNQEEIITRALWSGNVGNLLSFFTSSAQTATSKQYYYSIYNSGSGDCGSEPQFAVAWGHKQGSGSADQGGDTNDTPSRAIYGQYKGLCLDPDQERFVVGGVATDSIYVVNVNRARMREFIDEGNLELNLQALSGSEFMAGGGTVNAHTGSNVKVNPTQKVLRIVDDSRVTTATVTSAGEVYNLAWSAEDADMEDALLAEQADLQNEFESIAETRKTVKIFNPRQQTWKEHFFWRDVEVVGLTAVGRATVNTLRLNRAIIQAIRVEEEFFGRHPPP